MRSIYQHRFKTHWSALAYFVDCDVVVEMRQGLADHGLESNATLDAYLVFLLISFSFKVEIRTSHYPIAIKQ